MPLMNIYDLRESSVLLTYSIRKQIQIDPDYQRMGDVWNLEKRQLLIDSLINGYDIPKIYFHKFPKFKVEKGKEFKYAILDGRQRLQSIWSFINNEFPLADDFKLYEDNSVAAAKLTYGDIAKEYPELKLRFDARSLPIVCVETEDMDLIEEMFSRLNEAVPLNAAEKRNAFGGPMAKSIREVAAHQFFKSKVPYLDKRYQHREVAAKLLYLEYIYVNSKRIGNTKKVYLDRFVKFFKHKKPIRSFLLAKAVENILGLMNEIFIAKDKLLKTQGMLVTFFLTFKFLKDEAWFNKKVTRKALEDFERLRKENRKMAENDLADAKYLLLEFDRLSLQGINDSVSIQFRMSILKNYLEQVFKHGKKPTLSLFSQDQIIDESSELSKKET
jgi:hypothetical protein